MKLGYFILAAALAMSPSAFGLVQWTGLGQIVVSANRQVCIQEDVYHDVVQRLVITSDVRDTFPICDAKDPTCKTTLAIQAWRTYNHTPVRYFYECSYGKPGKAIFAYLDGINTGMGSPPEYVAGGSWKTCYKVTSDNPRGTLTFTVAPLT